MKKILFAMLSLLPLIGFAAQKSDTFTTPNGKTVVINHIKHASIHIEYDGRHIYVDPVGSTVQPETNYSLMPKAHIVLITHEHADHYDPTALSRQAHHHYLTTDLL